MVHVEKDFAAPPADLVDDKWDVLRQKCLVEQATHEAKTSCYRDTTLGPLVTLYNEKCAYCERNRGLELEVDHYRSKKPRNFQPHPGDNHPGYYWVCYEWSNLLPSCSKCNGKKSNKFPVNGTRVTSHLGANGQISSDLFDARILHQREQPHLLNPELDDNFELDFVFLNDGRVRGRSMRGAETIRICGLNRRQLQIDRLKILTEISRKIVEAFDDFTQHQEVAILEHSLRLRFIEISRGREVDHAFSLFHKYIYNYFRYYVGKYLPLNLVEVAAGYFEAYKSQV